jgi:hypothetical protein
LKPQ